MAAEFVRQRICRDGPIASFWTALRQVRSTLQRRHEATDGFNRIRKRRTFDPGCSSPWVSSAAASGASKPKWMTKCPWLAFAEGGGEARYVMGIVRERA